MTVTLTQQSGNIILLMFGCIAMVGVLGVTSMNLLKGPVRTMSQVTQRTIAENNMIASGKLALVMSSQTPGDCDNDGQIEPLEWSDPGGGPAPTHGGLLPPTIGAALMDPWGNAYGYCAWDHGSLTADAGCGVNPKRLAGGQLPSNPVLAIISAGPDRIYQTGCMPNGQAGYILKLPGSDDIVLSYSYAEATALSGGLWNLKQEDSHTATIAKNLSVTDEAGDEQLRFDAASKQLALGSGGSGHLPNIRTDYIQNLTDNAPIEFLSNIKTGAAWISGDGSNKGMKISADGNVDMSGNVEAAGTMKAGAADITTATANAVAAIVTASGADGIGLKATGTSKAIESEGLIDMTDHRIINMSDPSADQDAATKAYVDGTSRPNGRTVCESFTSSTCLGGVAVMLDKTNLGRCKKACEDANAQCCFASFPLLGNNPNAQLAGCTGYTGASQPVGTRLLTIVLGTLSAYCYKQY